LSIVEFITRFEEVAADLQAKIPTLNPSHPGYKHFCTLHAFDQEAYIRRLIPVVLKKMQD